MCSCQRARKKTRLAVQRQLLAQILVDETAVQPFCAGPTSQAQKGADEAVGQWRSRTCLAKYIHWSTYAPVSGTPSTLDYRDSRYNS